VRMRLLAALLIALSLCSDGSLATGGGISGPLITSISASPHVIPAVGGGVVVRVTAASSTTCVFSGVGSPFRVPCSRRPVLELFTFNPTGPPRGRRWTIHVVAVAGKRLSPRRQVTLTQSAAQSAATGPPPAATQPAVTQPAGLAPPTATLALSTANVPSSGG